jgi:hypothetical protein
VLTDLRSATEVLARHLAQADPDRVTSARAAELFAVFAEVERLGAAGKVLYARRAAQSSTWSDEGCSSAAAWMAQTTGSGLGDAVATLDAAEALGSLPATTEALKRGELSAPQLRAITAAAATHPEAEGELLQAAGAHSLKGLKQRCAAVAARAGSARAEHERYRALQAGRYARHWTDPDGAFRLDARLTPDAGARLASALGAEADARFGAARRAEHHEAPAAYAADALVALVTGEPVAGRPTSGTPRSTVTIRVDASALRRGHVEGAETCEIPGVGPVPVATATRLLSDAFVKIVVSSKHVSTSTGPGGTPAHRQGSLPREGGPLPNTCSHRIRVSARTGTYRS